MFFRFVRYLIFSELSLSFSNVIRLKEDIENVINMTSWNSLHKLPIVIFGRTEKLL